MFTKHYEEFNDAINEHGRYATPEEHDSVLYHEGRLYDLADEHIRFSGGYSPETFERSIAYMLYHVNAILSFTGAEITPECVLFELLDVQSARFAA